MPVFNTFLKVSKQNIPMLLSYFVIFLVLLLFMGQMAQDQSTSAFQMKSVDIAIIDEDQSAASEGLKSYLNSIHNELALSSYYKESLQDNLYYQWISYVLTIPEDFEQRLIEGDITDLVESSKRHDSASGYFIDQQINSYLSTVSLYLQGGYPLSEALELTDSSFSSTSDVEVLNFDKKSEAANTEIYYFFQYIPYVSLCMMILGMTPILITFRKQDLANRINCSSMPQGFRNFQLTLGCILYCLFIWGIFLVTGLIRFGAAVLFSTNGLLCILNSLVFILIATAITLFISTFSLSKNALNMIANMLTLSMCFLCGVFVPQWYLSDKILNISQFLPAYWYMRITNMLGNLSGEAMSMETYWTCIGIQLLFFAAIFAMYLMTANYRSLRRSNFSKK